MRAVVERAAGATDSEIAALALEAWAARRLRTFEDAERGLCFGRLDFETTPRPLYVGRRWVHDDDADELLVVNWQAPAARPFYVATPENPLDVTLRRRFRTEGRRLLDLSDEKLDGSGSVVGGDFLLDELERSREPHMRDIVATIQVGPVPAHHPRARPAARRPGRAGHREDGCWPAPGVVPPLLAPRAAPARARRRAQPHLHGVRLARPADARRGERGAAGGRRARRRCRGDDRRPAGGRAAEGRRPARRGARARSGGAFGRAPGGARGADGGRVHPRPRTRRAGAASSAPARSSG